MGDSSSASLKQRAVEQWTAEPAGAVLAAHEKPNSREFYREVERTRYQLYPWLRKYLTSGLWAGKKVLEIGVGLGTDHLMLYRAEAQLTGIDLTPVSIEHTQRRFGLEEASSSVKVGDAEALPFETASFDGVYSFGVLHHTPGMQQAIREIHRVLRPGGIAVVGLYNRHSYFHAWALLRHFVTGRWRQSSLEDMRAAFEHGDGHPLVVLSSRRELIWMFGDFQHVSIGARHLPTNRMPGRMRSAVDRLLRPVERRIGWYWMVVATR